MKNALNQINLLLRQRRIDEAETLSKKLISTYPQSEQGWIQLGRISQMKGDLPTMLAHARKAIEIAPNSVLARLQETEASLLCGKIDQAEANLTDLEAYAGRDASTLQQLAQFYIHLERYSEAMSCYQRARALIGDEPGLLYNIATTATALGDLDEAEALYDAVLDQDPHDYEAYYNRAALRQQTASKNHTSEMEKIINGELKNPGAKVQLGYALAKEYEDLEEYQKSWFHLKTGADCRKSFLSYNVAADVETMDEIKDVMQGRFFANCPPAKGEPGPIFILGLPRTGTTLVDRIISSHSDVESLGEINDFAQAFTRVAGQVKNKSELVQITPDLDYKLISKAYQKSTAQRRKNALYCIDKTPSNFLYIGMIAKALPNAKIIHLSRHPMDSCFAMYKTLFRMGYPFSYDLADLGNYYVAYHALMAHWRTQIPGRFLDVEYESLVSDQEHQSRRLIDHCGLTWEDQCLDFHNNQTASATASAAQVRQPIYQSSVGKWRHHASELAPLITRLENVGIQI